MPRSPRPVVVREEELHRSDAAGVTREVAHRTAGVQLERTRLEPGERSTWHVHPSRDAYGYVVGGEGRIAYGPGGRRSVDLAPGDFFVLPAGVVHREEAVGDDPTVTVVALVGEGSPVVERDGPPLREPTAAPRMRAESSGEPTAPLKNLTRRTPWPDAAVQQVRGHADGRIESDWHHHGDNDVFGYVLRGEGYVEWAPDRAGGADGTDGRETADVGTASGMRVDGTEPETGVDDSDTETSGDGWDSETSAEDSDSETSAEDSDSETSADGTESEASDGTTAAEPPADATRALAGAGEFFHVPPGVVHRDVNPSDAEQDYVLWLTGSEPRVVPADPPG